MLLPITGGTARPFLGEGAAAPAWTHDGRRLVFFTNSTGDPLSVAKATGADAREVPLQPDSFLAEGMHNHNPVWAADDRSIYFLHGPGSATTFNLGIWRVPPAGGVPQPVASQASAVSALAVIDSRTLLFIAYDRDDSGPWLWTLDLVSNATRRVITGLERYTSVSASADGRRVVATRTIARPARGTYRWQPRRPISTQKSTRWRTRKRLRRDFMARRCFTFLNEEPARPFGDTTTEEPSKSGTASKGQHHNHQPFRLTAVELRLSRR